MASEFDKDTVGAILWGGAAGMFGSVVRAIRSPSTHREFWSAIAVGALVGTVTFGGVLLFNQDATRLFAFLCALCAGFVSTTIAELSIKVSNRAAERLGRYAEKRMDSMEARQDRADNRMTASDERITASETANGGADAARRETEKP